MLAVTIISGASVLFFIVAAWLEVAKGPALSGPLLRRNFYRKASFRLMGALFLSLLSFRGLSFASASMSLNWSLVAALTIALAALNCIFLWRVKLGISRLRHTTT